jgi:hypothetical protein
LLAGAIINPRVLNPARPTARLLRRQEIILRRMGSITPPPAPLAVPSPPIVDPVLPPGEPFDELESPDEPATTAPSVDDSTVESSAPSDAAPPPEPAAEAR